MRKGLVAVTAALAGLAWAAASLADVSFSDSASPARPVAGKTSGKLLRGSLSVRVAGASVRRQYSFRVRTG